MTVKRFIRAYEFRCQILGGEVIVRDPIRISFQADKSIRGGLNKIQIQLYNLEERKRLALVKDAEEQTRIPFQLSVGYQGSLELLFRGTVYRGSNSRQGPDIITTIEGLDGGFDFLNAFTIRTVEGGLRAIDAALSDMANTGVGKITDRPVLTRPKVLVGNSARLIDDMVGPDETWYIDNEQLYVIKDNEVTSRFIPLVSAETGLISTPERENKEVTFVTLMNPSVKIGQRAQLQSKIAPHLNGVYRIDTISYQGDNFGDEWSQACTGLLLPNARVL
jgi:hypothetical protein